MSNRVTPPGEGIPLPSDRPHDSGAGSVARQAGGIAHESGELHRLLVESVRDYAIFALDPKGFILSWNAGAQRFKGYSAEEAIGQHFSIFYPQKKIDEHFPDHELEVASRTGRFEDEGWRVRKDGSRFWANVVITALRDQEGALIGFAKITRDLTERQASEVRTLDDARRLAVEETARRHAEARAKELQELAERLRDQALELEVRSAEAMAANQAKGSFLAAMSHELRTPLNAIGGYAELLQLGITGPVTPQQVEQLERIRRAQQHLLRVINDILNFSRVEAGQLDYDLGDVAMRDAMESVVQMVAPLAGKKRITLVPHECGPDLVAHADRAKVQQILLNLLSNALKFTRPGGEISIHCARAESAVVAVVQDTGIGIPLEKLEAIFEPFVQVGRSLTSDQDGTGLGLAISRDLARAMEGDLTAASTTGEGSTFTLTLPGVARAIRRSQ